MNDFTFITVCYNTKELIERSYNSIRKYHPDTPIIIVDGSDKTNDCRYYIKSLKSPYNTLVLFEENIGHGRGMDYAIRMSKTKYVVIFDSDIVMLKSPVEEMFKLMNKDIYGVGWIYEVGVDGFDYGTPGRNHLKAISYIHPYFMLLNVDQYFNFHPFIHHGAPCYKAFLDIYKKGLSDKILRNFKGLTGHTSGHGINWTGKPSEYIQHDFGGTRMANKNAGKPEINGEWER